MQTVVEEGVSASPQLKKFAAHVEHFLGASPRVANAPTAEDDSEVERSLNTPNEWERALLRKSAKQLFMGEIEELTTQQAGHIDLEEIGSAGQSELLSFCELLGGRTLGHSRETECDMLTSEGSARAASLLRDTCLAICEFRVPCGLWCPWRWRHRQDASEAAQRTTAGSRGIEVGKATGGTQVPSLCGNGLEVVRH